jgi:ATP-binding cassette subfamily B protein
MPDNLIVLTAKLRGAASQLRYLPQALGLVWAAAPRWTALWIVLLVVQGLLPAATVYLTRALVDSLVAALNGGGDWRRFQPALLLAAAMAGVMLLAQLLRSAAGWLRATQAELVQDHINALIHQKSTAVDLAFYETPDYYDHLHRARDQASYRPVSLLENFGELLQNSITLVAMAAILIPYGLWLPIALLLSTLPALVVALRYSLRQHRWRLRTTADERRNWYYDWLLTEGEPAAELRLFGLGEHLQSLYREVRGRLRQERLQLARDQSLAEAGAGTLALLVTGFSLLWMVWQVSRGLGSLGDLALFYQAFNQGQRLMRSLLGSVGQIYYNVLFLGDLFEFLSLEPQVIDPPETIAFPTPQTEGVRVRFREVTFRYPGSQRPALQNFNLAIPAGQMAAIVGPNGAGKSTLIKLLCRFYDPEMGAIEIDGFDLRTLSVQELRQHLTVLFQEPIHYNMTVSENIALGDLARGPGEAEIRAAARAAGASEPIARLPQNYETPLGKWFAGGAELSVGEWQRVALARAFLRQAPLTLLDEPTSAMDSWAETDWMRRFRQLAQGRTAVIITHRFSTAMQADVIHVMAQGQIVESGSHQQLLASGGRYAQSWQAQMRRAKPGPGADPGPGAEPGPAAEPFQAIVTPNGADNNKAQKIKFDHT